MKLLDNIITNFAFNVEGKNVRLWVSVELLRVPRFQCILSVLGDLDLAELRGNADVAELLRKHRAEE